MAGGILSDLLARVTDAGRAISGIGDAEPPTPEALAGLCADLLGGRGEATGLALAARILEGYAGFGTAERRDVLRRIATGFGPDAARLGAAVAEWQAAPGEAAARALHDAAEPRSQHLLRTLNRAPGGTAALVKMREDLIAFLRAEREAPEAGALAALDSDFRHLFASWFNRGFLELRSIDWNTSASVLEKIIAYEAVHAIQDWDDLRRRVAAPDRRLYGFFHPALPGEPLIFVEVALTDAIPAAIGPILAQERQPLDPKSATTAVFYSISNCQVGLRGISFGSFLIKQVVEELARETPSVKVFVTLSPVPGLRGWALAEARRGEAGLLDDELRATVMRLDPPDGSIDAVQAAEDAARLGRLTALYLLEGKGRGGLPADPVARFHLGNGARLERVNPGADHSARGLRGAWGVMVNYLYDLDEIEKNHEAFANERSVAASASVRRLLRA
ncbi:malonyl-CoA decarboxylase [Paralimibaculum aggregatum]|uniref:Malonyl-CoA decarboxylase n=1 Tax=Paralimibaculum aggregatum TaxID=3036245 RepID=A0ABQ6LNE2_9RHOB|nr:malonyl-CoA decarboxylase [Limibaculum sp. NKW23]GMG83227.1 malonyl-CoA decarboxylase [Limibaculum sp. NKW23]